MSARIPLDVDLEDRLLYGLTPIRLAYVVVALLAGFALWSSHWAPPPVRAFACLVVIGTGAAFAWGRWRGRAVDAWATDIAFFAIRNYRVTWNEDLFIRMKCGRSNTPRRAGGQPAETEAEEVAAAA